MKKDNLYRYVEIKDRKPAQEQEVFWDGGENPPSWGRFRTIGKFDYVVTIDSSGEEDLNSITEYVAWFEPVESPTTADASVLVEALERIHSAQVTDGEEFNFDPGQFIYELKGIARKALADYKYPGMTNQIKAQSTLPNKIEESGLKEGEDVLRDMYNDECCLKHILLKAVNEIIAGTGENALEIAKKAKLEYEDIVQMK